MKLWLRLLPLALAPSLAFPQAEPDALAGVLREEILPPAVALHELREHILARVPKPPAPRTAAEWTEASKRMRQKLLAEVVFHGWPAEWVAAPPRFEETGVVEGAGYRIRKLRYEIVPGFFSAALLYEPAGPAARRPAILNVNGHVGPPGKTVEYEQKRRITFAKNGILALGLEWPAFGELAAKGNSHWYAPHLDLVGANGVGLFYLAMRKGLDYLAQHPGVDPRADRHDGPLGRRLANDRALRARRARARHRPGRRLQRHGREGRGPRVRRHGRSRAVGDGSLRDRRLHRARGAPRPAAGAPDLQRRGQLLLPGRNGEAGDRAGDARHLRALRQERRALLAREPRPRHAQLPARQPRAGVPLLQPRVQADADRDRQPRGRGRGALLRRAGRRPAPGQPDDPGPRAADRRRLQPSVGARGRGAGAARARRAPPAGLGGERLAGGQHEARRRRDGVVSAGDERRAARERRLAEGCVVARRRAGDDPARRRRARPDGRRGGRAAEPRRAGAGAGPRVRGRGLGLARDAPPAAEPERPGRAAARPAGRRARGGRALARGSRGCAWVAPPARGQGQAQPARRAGRGRARAEPLRRRSPSATGSRASGRFSTSRSSGWTPRSSSASTCTRTSTSRASKHSRLPRACVRPRAARPRARASR